jgi:hypothetical protein
MYIAECPKMTLGKESLCRVSTGWHSAKYSEIIFAECRPGDTRQRGLCRVPDRGHLAKSILKLKKSLPSARSWALGKERVHSVCGNSFLSYSLTVSYLATAASTPPCRRHAHAPPRPCPRPSPRPRRGVNASPTRRPPSTCRRRHVIAPPRHRASPAATPSATAAPSR